jgi:uncharacterized protein YjbJ (UPF0337 family)
VRSASRTSEGSVRKFYDVGRDTFRRLSLGRVGNKTSMKSLLLMPPCTRGCHMDKDRIKGSAEQAKGAVKEAAGKLLGDKKLEAEGKTDKAVGKMQNAIGGFKDTLRGK